MKMQNCISDPPAVHIYEEEIAIKLTLRLRNVFLKTDIFTYVVGPK